MITAYYNETIKPNEPNNYTHEWTDIPMFVH